MNELVVGFSSDGRIHFNILGGSMGSTGITKSVLAAEDVAKEIHKLCAQHREVKAYESRLSRETRTMYDRYLSDASRWKFLVDLYNEDHPGKHVR